MMLQDYNYTLTYKEGKKMTIADALSRRPDHELAEKDNQNSIVIPPHRIATLETNLTPTGHPEHVVNPSRESEVEEGVEDLSLSVEEYYEKHKQMITNILHAYHDSPMGGHSGVEKTLAKVKANGYNFHHCKEIIKLYISRCKECQKAKIFPRKPFSLLKPTEIPDEPWKHITVDLITGLPESQGYDTILVVVDKFSKMAHYIPTRKELSSEGLTRLFLEKVWKHHGLLEKIISDRGPQFASKFTKELHRLLGIDTALSTVYHPQTDGQTERVNQEIEAYLRIFARLDHYEWPNWLPMAEYSHNARVHSSTGVSPFVANTGRNPVEPTTQKRSYTIPGAADMTRNMRIVWKHCRKSIV